jgi:hypothetical protein
MQNHA